MLLQQNAFQEQIGRTVYVGNLNPKVVLTLNAEW